MELIHEPEAGTRLARAILVDIERYGPDRLRETRLHREAIEEGRALYRSRVVRGLYDAFETELAELDRRTGNLGDETGGSAPPIAREPEDPVSALFGGEPNLVRVVTAIMVVVGVAAALAYQVLRR